MSYSYSVKAATKALAVLAAAAKFEEIVSQQPIHARDRAAVQANIDGVVGLLADDEDKDVSISVNGYVSWPGGSVEDAKLSTVSIAASASHMNREMAAAA